MATATAVRTLRVDKAHSEAAFQVRHLISKVRGRFSEFSGTVEFDAEFPERSRVDVTIDAASVDTSEPRRDDHLRSPDFFDVARHPAITFRSVRVVPRASDRFDVEGDLTIRGVTRRVVLPAVYLGTAVDPWGQDKAAFEAELTLNRRDFGLTWNAALETGGVLVGDEVKVQLSIQAA